MLFDQVGEFRDEIAVPAEFQFEFDAVLVEVDPPLVEAVARRLDQPTLQPVESAATPEGEGGANVSNRLVGVLRGTGRRPLSTKPTNRSRSRAPSVTRSR